MELADLRGLTHAAPALHVEGIDRQHLGVGVAEEVLAEAAARPPELVTEQQERRLDGAAGDHDRARAHADLSIRPARVRVDGPADHAHAASAFDPQALDADLGQAARARRHGSRHVAHERGLLRARGAAEPAVVGAHAGLLVALVHGVAPAHLLGTRGHQPVVFADALRAAAAPRARAFRRARTAARSRQGPAPARSSPTRRARARACDTPCRR